MFLLINATHGVRRLKKEKYNQDGKRKREKVARKKRALPKKDLLSPVKSTQWKNRTSDGLITDSACELLNLQLQRHERAHLVQA